MMIAQQGLQTKTQCGGLEMGLLVKFWASKNQWLDICKTICLFFVDIIFQMLVKDILIENRAVH